MFLWALVASSDLVWNAIRQDRAKAVEILVKDLKVFASFNEELFKEITQLLTLDNFRFLLNNYFWFSVL